MYRHKAAAAAIAALLVFAVSAAARPAANKPHFKVGEYRGFNDLPGAKRGGIAFHVKSLRKIALESADYRATCSNGTETFGSYAGLTGKININDGKFLLKIGTWGTVSGTIRGKHAFGTVTYKINGCDSGDIHWTAKRVEH